MSLFTPVNQKRLTNVSVVRLKKGGNRYELACYPNKVRAWRENLETNLDEVLQVRCVFTNVSKGQFANEKEVYKDFRTDDLIQIIKIILKQGQLQLTEKERRVEHQTLFRDTAKIISERCVNPENNRPYTVTMVEKMMKDCHISLNTSKTAKQHALEVTKQLRSTTGLKIAPAMLEAVITLEPDALTPINSSVHELCDRVLREGITSDGLYELVVVIEPEKYIAIETLLHNEVKGKYGVEIIGNAGHVYSNVSRSNSSAISGKMSPDSVPISAKVIELIPSSLTTVDPPQTGEQKGVSVIRESSRTARKRKSKHKKSNRNQWPSDPDDNDGD